MAGYTEQDKEKWIEIAQDTGVSIESGVPTLKLSELDNSVSIPGVKFTYIEYDSSGNATGFGKPESFAQMPLGTIGIKTEAAQNAANNANAAATRANAASDGAETVNATLVGMTVTVTDRSGQSTSVNIGFEITPDHVYSSRSEMMADAANVDAGKFCMIATTDPTSTDNATLWSRNTEPSTSETPFTFLSDLDQAATHVWDDWNQNLRQSIVNATNDAIAAATNANSKAALADAAATNANTEAANAKSIYDTVRGWFEGNNGFKSTSESWLANIQSVWNDWFSDSLSTGVRKLWNDFWSNINTSWNGFWGTSATDPNGVRKQWSDLHFQATQDHSTALSDHTTAESDHTTADADHTTALSDHTTAGSDHTTALSDHTTADADHTASTNATLAAANAASYANDKGGYASNQGDYAKNLADHPAYIGNDNYWYIWNYDSQQYVKSSPAKGDDLHWDEMTEEEKEELAQKAIAQIVFATPETCASIVDELV